MMKNSPYILLSVSIMLSVIFFGVLLRNLERAKLNRNGKYDSFWDSLWIIIIIMLTSKICQMLTYLSVGYGDITIDTNFGRLIGIVAAFWGFLVYSLFIVSMNVLIKQD